MNISRYSPKNIKLLFLKYSTIGELFVNLKSFTLCRVLILWKVCKSSGKGYDLFHKMFIHTHVPPCPERDPTVCVCVFCANKCKSSCKICLNIDTFFTTQLIHILLKAIDSKNIIRLWRKWQYWHIFYNSIYIWWRKKHTTLQELLTFKLNFRVINDIGLIFQIDIHNQLP